MSSGMDFRVSNHSLAISARSVNERIFYVNMKGKLIEPPRPTPGYYDENLKSVFKLLRRLAFTATPLGSFAYANSITDRRKKVYLQAAQDNLDFGFDDEFARLSTFLKVEFYNLTLKSDVVNRLIQPRQPRYLIETGRYFTPIEKTVYKSLNTMFGFTAVYKGLNADQRGEAMFSSWSKYSDPIAISFDFKRFDQHVSNQALRWEHNVYKCYYPNDSWFAHLLELQLYNRGALHNKNGSVYYKTIHCRCSGDHNTGLGNTLLVCSMVYAYFKHIKITADLADDGDDGVIITERKNYYKILSTMEDYFIKFGFQLTIEEPVYVFEQIVFCQMSPILSNTGRYTMLRNPKISTSKDTCSVKPLDNPIIAKRWCSAVALGGRALGAGMPVVQEYYRCLERYSEGLSPLTDPTLEGGFYRLSRGMRQKSELITPETRYSFFLAFGITPDEQECLEDYYRTLRLTVGDLKARFAIIPL